MTIKLGYYKKLKKKKDNVFIYCAVNQNVWEKKLKQERKKKNKVSSLVH